MQWFHRRSTKCGRGRRRRRRTNSARISHPPPFRRVTKNGTNCLHAWHAGVMVGVFKRPGSAWTCLWEQSLKRSPR